jgi:uncharacterized protein (TIGR02270 family)
MLTRSAIPVVVDQHVDDLAALWTARRALVNSGGARLIHLDRFDRRIRANTDGCVVAGTEGVRMLTELLEQPDSGRLFAASVVSLEVPDRAAFQRCAVTSAVVGDPQSGLLSALGWVDRGSLTGLVRQFLSTATSSHRSLALAVCRLHGVDPGAPLQDGLRESDPNVRAEALRTIGTLGMLTNLSACIPALSSDGSDVRFWAAWSAVLLGNRGAALETLMDAALSAGPQRSRAFRLALQAMPVSGAHGALQSLARDPKDLRWLIQGSGIVGDATYIPWLIGHMAHERYARLAGEAFSLITGTDLALLDLERKPPENFESGPNDDPDDPNVDTDPDDGLPWPDPDRIKDWWAKNSGRFQPGQRYVMGAPVTREHCIEVLKNGYQRQRVLAAHYLCLLDPGTPLFNTSAPAWRQQKLLAQMS